MTPDLIDRAWGNMFVRDEKIAKLGTGRTPDLLRRIPANPSRRFACGPSRLLSCHGHAAPTPRRLVRRQGLVAAPAPAGHARPRGRPRDPADRPDRRRQDAGRASCPPSPNWPTAPRKGLHTLYISPLKALAADIRRNLRSPGRGRGPADPDRGPHRRHHLHPAPPPARRPAAYPADHARKPRPAAQLRRRPAHLRRPRTRHRRRDPRARRKQARRPVDARPFPPRKPSPPACAASASRPPSKTRPPSPASSPGTPIPAPSSSPIRGRSPTSPCWRPKTPPPWAGGGGRYAIPAILDEVKRHRTTLDLPQHPRPGRAVLPRPLARRTPTRCRSASTTARLAREQRERVEAAMVAGQLRADRLHRHRSTSASTGATWTS